MSADHFPNSVDCENLNYYPLHLHKVSVLHSDVQKVSVVCVGWRDGESAVCTNIGTNGLNKEQYCAGEWEGVTHLKQTFLNSKNITFRELFWHNVAVVRQLFLTRFQVIFHENCA